jgi:hypothetical protein
MKQKKEDRPRCHLNREYSPRLPLRFHLLRRGQPRDLLPAATGSHAEAVTWCSGGCGTSLSYPAPVIFQITAACGLTLREMVITGGIPAFGCIYCKIRAETSLPASCTCVTAIATGSGK